MASRIARRASGKAGLWIALLAWPMLIHGVGAHAVDPPPVADMHLHYRWNQKEVISAQEVIDKLRAQNVVLATVGGTPSDLALELREAGGERIYPFFTPYITGRSRYDWWSDERVLERAREGLAAGRYHGIGEMHLIGGMPPARDNRIVQGLIELAGEHDVPVLIHTEASDYRYFLPLCEDHPDVRFQWAHAGGHLGPEQVGSLMAKCPSVWVDLSARDPWRYGGFAGEDGELPPEWLVLIERYPERFVIGSDPVWPGYEMHHWDRADTGWERFEEFLAFQRRWVDRLPDPLARKIRLTNGYRLLGLEPPAE